jgi:hypothetical protein
MKPYTFSCYPPFGGWPERGKVEKAKEKPPSNSPKRGKDFGTGTIKV